MSTITDPTLGILPLRKHFAIKAMLLTIAANPLETFVRRHAYLDGVFVPEAIKCLPMNTIDLSEGSVVGTPVGVSIAV